MRVDKKEHAGPVKSDADWENEFFAAVASDSDDDIADGDANTQPGRMDAWLRAEDGRTFDKNIKATPEAPSQFVNGLADLPTPEQLEAMIAAPEIPAKNNAAEGYPDKSPPFVAGICISSLRPVNYVSQTVTSKSVKSQA